MAIDCPSCEKAIRGLKCDSCGAEMSINQNSGNVIWMRRGRVILAPDDKKEQWIKHAEAWAVEKDQWPDEFKE